MDFLGIKEISKDFGKVPFCNGKKERALNIRGFCFPLCYRCMSVIFGFFTLIVISKITNALYFISEYSIVSIMLIPLFFAIPMIIDGTAQYMFHKESTNVRRVITGLLFSIGMFISTEYLKEIIRNLIVSLRIN